MYVPTLPTSLVDLCPLPRPRWPVLRVRGPASCGAPALQQGHLDDFSIA